MKWYDETETCVSGSVCENVSVNVIIIIVDLIVFSCLGGEWQRIKVV
jgi:hypothetical protein